MPSYVPLTCLVPEMLTVLPTAVGHVGILQLADWVMLGGGGGGGATVPVSAWASAVASGVDEPPASALLVDASEPDELPLPASTRAELLLPPLLEAPLELLLDPVPVGADASGVGLEPLLFPEEPPLLPDVSPGGSGPVLSGVLEPHATPRNKQTAERGSDELSLQHETSMDDEATAPPGCVGAAGCDATASQKRTAPGNRSSASSWTCGSWRVRTRQARLRRARASERRTVNARWLSRWSVDGAGDSQETSQGRPQNQRARVAERPSDASGVLDDLRGSGRPRALMQQRRVVDDGVALEEVEPFEVERASAW